MSVGTAMLSVAWGRLTGLDDTYLVAMWAGVNGAVEFAAALDLRRFVRGELLLACSGLVSLALGALLPVLPMTRRALGATACWIGAYALLFGTLLIALSVCLHRLVRLPAIAEI